MSIKVAVLGACGRMGRALAAALEHEPAGVLVAACEHAGHPQLGTMVQGITLSDDVGAAMAACDVVIDFSVPAALRPHLDRAVAAGKPMVIGTTGLDQHHFDAIAMAAQHVPVLYSANMSVGVNVLAMLVEQTARQLGTEWDIEIVEMHHRHKVDAPSGTALLLGRAAAAGRRELLSDVEVRGRDGITGARQAGSIGFASLRGGSVAGDHMVIFASDDERLEFTHRAESREIFARGALRAALWLVQQPKGHYALRDLLMDRGSDA